MIGLILDELQVNATQAALDHWTQYLSERLARHEQETETPAQRDAIESLSMALSDVDRVKEAIREALADPETEYPADATYEGVFIRGGYSETYEFRVSEPELRALYGDR